MRSRKRIDRPPKVAQTNAQATLAADSRATQVAFRQATTTVVAATQQAVQAAALATATAAAGQRTATVATQTAVAALTATASAPTPIPTPTMRLAIDPNSPIPLTSFGETLLLLRDYPQLLTDDTLLAITKQRIQVEQMLWQEADRYGKASTGQQCANYRRQTVVRISPTRSTFTFEWQKYLAEQPDFARGPLLDAFVREDADWSFVRRESNWDDNYDNFVQVFVFNRSSIDGRLVDFAAPELMPVMKQLIQAAAPKTPTRFMASIEVPSYYDLPSQTFRFGYAFAPQTTGPYDALGPGCDAPGESARRPESLARVSERATAADRRIVPATGRPAGGAAVRRAFVAGYRALPIADHSRIATGSAPGGDVRDRSTSAARSAAD